MKNLQYNGTITLNIGNAIQSLKNYSSLVKLNSKFKNGLYMRVIKFIKIIAYFIDSISNYKIIK